MGMLVAGLGLGIIGAIASVWLEDEGAATMRVAIGLACGGFITLFVWSPGPSQVHMDFRKSTFERCVIRDAKPAIVTHTEDGYAWSCATSVTHTTRPAVRFTNVRAVP